MVLSALASNTKSQCRFGQLGTMKVIAHRRVRGQPTQKKLGGGPVYGVGQLQGNNFGDKWLKSAGGTGEYIAPTSIGTCSATGASGASDAVVSNSLRGVAASVNQVDASYTAPINEAGITVPGSVSNQTFGTTTMRALEAEEHVIVLRILGETDAGIKVMAPVTVKAKPKCVTCGRTNKATNKDLHLKYVPI